MTDGWCRDPCRGSVQTVCPDVRQDLDEIRCLSPADSAAAAHTDCNDAFCAVVGASGYVHSQSGATTDDGSREGVKTSAGCA